MKGLNRNVNLSIQLCMYLYVISTDHNSTGPTATLSIFYLSIHPTMHLSIYLLYLLIITVQAPQPPSPHPNKRKILSLLTCILKYFYQM